MREITARAGQELAIGKRGENKAACVVFDISDWRAMYGAGTVQLIHQRNGDKIPYPCVVEMSGGAALWTITNTDVANPGVGRAELQYWVGDSIVKSEIFSTKTARSMGDAGETPPEPATTWLEQMQQLGTETEENANAAEASAKAAEASAASVADVAADAQEAKRAAEAASKSAVDAAASEESAAASSAKAQTAQKAAESAISTTASSANAAAQSASAASTSASNAASSASSAATSAQSANAAKENVAANAAAASSSASAAAQSASKAATSERNAADAEAEAKSAAENAAAGVQQKLNGYVEAADAAAAAAKDAQGAAEKARDEAQQAAGGDFATPAYVDDKAEEAESNAKSYTDQKIAAIPTPDVSGQVGAHNSATDAHSDIRTALSSHAGNTTVHITADERTAWNAKASTSAATQSAAGLMSASDKSKLDGIASGANKITVDSSLSSSSTNPVQNNVIHSALSGKANSSHGNHVPTTETADNARFLRNDNTWQTVTPANIGAAASSHTHTKSQITDFPTSMTPTSHNQAASTITAGTFAGQVVANSSGETYSTYLLRNCRLASSDTNPTVNGEICWTYK